MVRISSWFLLMTSHMKRQSYNLSYFIITFCDSLVLLHNYIIELGKKVDRSFVIDNQLMCVCNISKEAIFMIIVGKNNLFLGYEGLKKVTDFFNKNSKLELVSKKYLEVFIH